MGHRRGRGQILTADQLADRLAVPCFYILQGRAQAAFPEASVPGPSSFVQVVLIRPPFQISDYPFFPVTVNWRQWEEILVPILEDPKWTTWQGLLGGTTETTHGGTPQTPTSPGHGLYSDDFNTEILLLAETIRELAINYGYGAPDQTTDRSC